MQYKPQSFDIPKLDGISEQTIEEHLKLYEGYVKHVNLIHGQIDELSNDADPNAGDSARAGKNGYAIAEMQRRLGFEFGGMKNHEYYFSQFVGGAKELSEDTELYKSLTYLWGSFDDWLTRFKQIAATRGVGWAMLYLDRKEQRLVQTWVDEQHLGQLADLDIILGIDMWEHSYMLDYPPSEKKKYIDAFFKNLNWETVAGRI